MTTIEQYLAEQRRFNEQVGAWTWTSQEMSDAIRAVAELHAPVKFSSTDQNPHCAECELDQQVVPAPCATRLVIYRALGIDGKDQT